MLQITCFGEVLWDVFPTYRRIGGAPLNVALRLHSLGADVKMISRVGNDKDGSEIYDYAASEGLSTAYFQKDQKLSTGTVDVHLDESNTASYTINSPAAWDMIEPTSNLKEVVEQSDAIIFGSLVCRNETSKSTLIDLLKISNYKIFDLNLRPPNYDLDVVSQLMHRSDFIKMNDEELEIISSHLGVEGESITELVQGIKKHLGNDKSICITKGADGAELYLKGRFYTNSGYRVNVTDTVGAGDSFLATIIYNLLKGESTQKALDKGCAMGSLVASKEGANPKIRPDQIERLMDL